MTHNTIGTQAAAALLQAVQLRWFNAAPRVAAWQSTLADAYDAYDDLDQGRKVHLPDGATTPDGYTTDTAANVLDAFDNWLGRNVVWEALDAVQGALDDLDDTFTFTDDKGVQLAIRLGW